MYIVILAVAAIIILCLLPDKSAPENEEHTVKFLKSNRSHFDDDESETATRKGIGAANKAYMRFKYRK